MSSGQPSGTDLQRILASARRLGVEMSEGEALVQQTDRLILDMVKALDDDREAESVKELLRLRDSLVETGDAASPPVEASRAQIINLVNNFFHERLTAVPSIQAHITEQQAQP